MSGPASNEPPPGGPPTGPAAGSPGGGPAARPPTGPAERLPGGPPADPAALAAALGRALRAGGLPVDAHRSVAFARAVGALEPLTPARLYWAARAIYVSDPDDVPAFDAVFALVFGTLGETSSAPPDLAVLTAAEEAPADAPGEQDGAATDADATAEPPTDRPGAPGSPAAAANDDNAPAQDDRDPAGTTTLPGDAERLATRDFRSLDEHELAVVRRLIRALDLAAPMRRRRRTERHRGGERPDRRATLRAARATGGEPSGIATQRRREAPRRLVLLCDVSGSMEPYARAYLQLLESAVVGARAEAFTFATRLTRVTQELRDADPDAALRRAAAAAPDWAGGTRIGAALSEFNRHHGRRGLARGAIVIILSDGWERSDPALVGREMERLSRLARRIVWVNPLAADDEFQPIAGGMAAAHPYCDELLSGHSLAALEEVVAAVGRDSRHGRDGARGPARYGRL